MSSESLKSFLSYLPEGQYLSYIIANKRVADLDRLNFSQDFNQTLGDLSMNIITQYSNHYGIALNSFEDYLNVFGLFISIPVFLISFDQNYITEFKYTNNSTFNGIYLCRNNSENCYNILYYDSRLDTSQFFNHFLSISEKYSQSKSFQQEAYVAQTIQSNTIIKSRIVSDKKNNSGVKGKSHNYSKTVVNKEIKPKNQKITDHQLGKNLKNTNHSSVLNIPSHKDQSNFYYGYNINKSEGNCYFNENCSKCNKKIVDCKGLKHDGRYTCENCLYKEKFRDKKYYQYADSQKIHFLKLGCCSLLRDKTLVKMGKAGYFIHTTCKDVVKK